MLSFRQAVLAVLVISACHLTAAPGAFARGLLQEDGSPLPNTDDVDYEGEYKNLINKSPEYKQVPVAEEQSTVIPDSTVSDASSDKDSIIPDKTDSSADREAAATARCASNVAGRVVWALASAGGRTCPAACRGYNGARSAALVAVNAGNSRNPSYLCRTGDPSFGQNRAGFSQQSGGRATPCYAYSRGGRGGSAKILAGGRMNCACVADRKRASFKGCKNPVWKATNSGNCASVCGSNRRIAVPDAPGSPKYVCRPSRSMRVGWAAAEGGKQACHYATNTVVTNAKGFSSDSVYGFSYDCLCI